jgi:hypothetical protein
MRRKGLKGWTISSALRPLSIILGQAARKGRIPVNPVAQLERVNDLSTTTSGQEGSSH